MPNRGPDAILSLAATIGPNSIGSVLLSDHCYNRTNDGIPPPPANMPMFEHDGDERSGQYRFVGLNYPYTGPLCHYPMGGPRRQVGEWAKGRLKWYARQQHAPETRPGP